METCDDDAQTPPSDPDGAITAARTLLETVCKSILETKGIGAYSEGDDLPKLYFKTAEYLNLAPSQHTEETFKAILGSCQNVVNSLGTLRNKIGDAHGQGRRPIRPSKRHAALAVNLAGAMATFLVQTYADKKSAL
jgi:Abortive infection C-terminus